MPSRSQVGNSSLAEAMVSSGVYASEPTAEHSLFLLLPYKIKDQPGHTLFVHKSIDTGACTHLHASRTEVILAGKRERRTCVFSTCFKYHTDLYQ